MKNILIIVPSLRGGGAERVASLLSQKLSEKHNVYLVIFNGENMVYSYGGKLINIDIKSHKNIFMKIINVFRRSFKVKKIKAQYKIQSSISLLDTSNIVNVFSKLNEKTIVSIHSNLATEKIKFIGSLNKFIYNKSDKVIGVSKGVSNNLINNYKLNIGKVDHIYNPVDFNNISILSREKVCCNDIFNQESFIITSMGRLTNAKGQWHLVRALSYVKKEIENVKLLIIGEGDLENYLRELIKQLDLTDNVIFLGYQKNPFKYIKKSDLFVLSSLYEGFGNVIIEAMACGTPVISTDCRFGPREILAPQTDINKETKEIEYERYGILVPVCDGTYYSHEDPLTLEEKLLAKSIIETYNNIELRNRYSSKGLHRVKDFEINSIAEKWENLL